MRQLLDRIKQLVARPIKGKKNPIVVFPQTATASEIAKAEARLGFELPATLKMLYTEVANGGFGPGDGFLGVPGRKATGGLDLVQGYRNCARGRKLEWPPHLLPVVYAGCDVYFCIDCDDAKNRVVVFDGDLGGLEESDISEPRSQWPYPENRLAVCFRTRAKSFEDFLEMWLADETQLYRWV